MWRNKTLKTEPIINHITPEPDPLTDVQEKPRRQIVKADVKIGKMSIRYIYPDPAPKFIEFLQQLQHEDVDFVKIPISKKESALYLRQPITKLLCTLTGVHWDKVSDLIKLYNNDDISEDTYKRVRGALLNLMDLATYFADEEHIEFIRDPVPHV